LKQNKLLLVAPQLPQGRFSVAFTSLLAAPFDQEDGRSTLNASRRKQLIQIANDVEAVLNAYEHLALRVFVVGMLIYELIRAEYR
jgi:hypothetical protein